MGYWLHAINADPTSGSNYATMPDARSALTEGLTITFQLTAAEDYLWRERERGRFESGEYIKVPWYVRSECRDHFAHLSLKRPGLIAYTKTAEHGYLDRQTAVRPGRYLSEYYDGVFSDPEYQRLIALCALTSNAPALCFAVTADDIETVYTGGPQSCMSHIGMDRPGCRHSDCNGTYRRSDRCRAYSGNVHPVRVYGNSDLAVAYIGPIDHVSARCVVWPDRMLYSRIYGSDMIIESLLRSAGYTPGSMSGARIRRIRYRDGFIMPYVDGCGSAEDTGRTWVILRDDDDGDINVCSTAGLVNDTPIYECEHCGSSYAYDENDGNSQYCPDCADAVWNCVECGSDYFSDDDATRTYDGSYLCETCANDLTQTCADPDCDTDWIECVEFGYRQRRDRRDRHVAEYCRDCADHYAHCADCDDVHRIGDCPERGTDTEREGSNA